MLMAPVVREQQAPESYATFWEPVATEPMPFTNTSVDTEEASDAYSEFVNLTEAVPAPRPAE